MSWVVLALMFVATTINYLDRAVLGVLLPDIRKQLAISTDAYGIITFSFQIAYAIGALACGKLLDKYGTRIGFGVAATVWSIAATLNAFATSTLHFGMLRTLLGLGESANFPACTKATAELFPPEKRATAMGVINFGTNFANVIGPPLFIWIALSWGWQACFAIIGGIGFLWLPAWFMAYRPPAEAPSPASEAAKLSIRAVLRYRQAWGYAWAKFLTDPVWWFYLFWIPTYLNDVRHFTAVERATALTILYAISGIGSVAGGAVSSHLMKRGWHVGRARKTTMLVCAVIMPFSALGVVVRDSNLAILLFSIGLAAHQAWMTNLFTTPADVFPKEAVGSTNGLGVSLGGLGGSLGAGLIPGYVIPIAGYIPVLLIMSCFYLVAWVLVHRLMGNLEPVSLGKAEERVAAGVGV